MKESMSKSNSSNLSPLRFPTDVNNSYSSNYNDYYVTRILMIRKTKYECENQFHNLKCLENYRPDPSKSSINNIIKYYTYLQNDNDIEPDEKTKYINCMKKYFIQKLQSIVRRWLVNRKYWKEELVRQEFRYSIYKSYYNISCKCVKYMLENNEIDLKYFKKYLNYCLYKYRISVDPIEQKDYLILFYCVCDIGNKKYLTREETYDLLINVINAPLTSNEAYEDIETIDPIASNKITLNKLIYWFKTCILYNI